MIHIDLPRWAFDASHHLAKARSDHFLNRFYNKRLRELHGATEYSAHVESIAGYMGEIGAAVALGLDPEAALRAMIVATGGMTRRDFGDLEHDGWSTDVKIEDFGQRHAAVLSGRIRRNQTYGCRLVNLEQYQENGDNVDHYLFGVFDPPLATTRRLHQASRIAWLGCTDSAHVADARHGNVTPSGGQLRSPAKFIPHSSLKPPETLLNLPPGPRRRRDVQPTAFEARRIDQIGETLSDIVQGRQVGSPSSTPGKKQWNGSAGGSTMR